MEQIDFFTTLPKNCPQKVRIPVYTLHKGEIAGLTVQSSYSTSKSYFGTWLSQMRVGLHLSHWLFSVLSSSSSSPSFFFIFLFLDKKWSQSGTVSWPVSQLHLWRCILAPLSHHSLKTKLLQRRVLWVCLSSKFATCSNVLSPLFLSVYRSTKVSICLKDTRCTWFNFWHDCLACQKG